MTHQPLTGLSAVREQLDLIEHLHQQGDYTDDEFDELHAAAVEAVRAIARPELPTLAEVGDKLTAARVFVDRKLTRGNTSHWRDASEVVDLLAKHCQRLQAVEQELQAAEPYDPPRNCCDAFDAWWQRAGQELTATECDRDELSLRAFIRGWESRSTVSRPDTTAVSAGWLEAHGAVWKDGNMVLQTEYRRIHFLNFIDRHPRTWAICGDEHDAFAYLRTICGHIERWQVLRFFQVTTGDPGATLEELVQPVAVTEG